MFHECSSVGGWSQIRRSRAVLAQKAHFHVVLMGHFVILCNMLSSCMLKMRYFRDDLSNANWNTTRKIVIKIVKIK